MRHGPAAHLVRTRGEERKVGSAQPQPRLNVDGVSSSRYRTRMKNGGVEGDLDAMNGAATREAVGIIAERSRAPQEQRLRRLDIQHPFSQLILLGVKVVEARRCPLGHRDIASAGEELFLIETPPKGADAALLGDSPLCTPPRYAQVVGAVTSSK